MIKKREHVHLLRHVCCSLYSCKRCPFDFSAGYNVECHVVEERMEFPNFISALSKVIHDKELYRVLVSTHNMQNMVTLAINYSEYIPEKVE